MKVADFFNTCSIWLLTSFIKLYWAKLWIIITDLKLIESFSLSLTIVFILDIKFCSLLVNFPTTKISMSLNEIINSSIKRSVWLLSFEMSLIFSIKDIFLLISSCLSSILFFLFSFLLISLTSICLSSSSISSSNKGVSNPAESSKHILLSPVFSPFVYFILIPFVSILHPVGIITPEIKPKIKDLPTLFNPKTPIFNVSILIISSYTSFLFSL